MKRFLIQLSAFIIGFIAHFIYASWDLYRAVSKYGGAPFDDYLTTYSDRFEFLNGLIIGLLFSFFMYIGSKYIIIKNLQAILKGCIVPVIIFLVPGFLLGCFGPFFGFYIKKVGIFYEFLITPVILLLTIISTTVGYVMIRNRTR